MLETELLDKLKELNIGKLTNVKKKFAFIFSYSFVTLNKQIDSKHFIIVSNTNR